MDKIVTETTPVEGASAPSPDETAAPSGGNRRGVIVTVVVGSVLVVLMALLGASLKASGSKLDQQDPSGGQAPDFTLPLLHGEGTLSLTDLRGQFVMLNYWASWCIPCKKEAPVLAAGYARWGEQVKFLGVDGQDSKAWAIEFETKYGIEYESVVDELGEVSTKYGVFGYPETFFIDPQGRIVSKVIGPMTSEVLDEHVQELLATS